MTPSKVPFSSLPWVVAIGFNKKKKDLVKYLTEGPWYIFLSSSKHQSRKWKVNAPDKKLECSVREGQLASSQVRKFWLQSSQYPTELLPGLLNHFLCAAVTLPHDWQTPGWSTGGCGQVTLQTRESQQCLGLLGGGGNLWADPGAGRGVVTLTQTSQGPGFRILPLPRSPWQPRVKSVVATYPKGITKSWGHGARPCESEMNKC